ncbi:uncharacterized protein LOC109839265 [Asparagus officinalis]|uniref:uncharacterized protein LOC109839265 n=1 Tax=Asparagus officinalis TaxID=4686 RepID=UPI00098E49A1|nr:uncharacterized protein LOC109839265 [Asparagus officinalis]
MPGVIRESVPAADPMIALKASEKNKEIRNNQTLLHTAGSKSFARIRRDMEKELNRPPTDAEVFLETRKKKKKAQPEKTLEMIDTLEQLTQEQTEGESVDAWHLVNRKEHPGRVRLRGRAITQTMLKSNKEKTIDPCDLVPESIVQAITKKVVATQQEEMKKHQEAQAASMIQTFAEMLSEVTGRSVSPSFVERFKARTRLPEEAASVLDHDSACSLQTHKS